MTMANASRSAQNGYQLNKPIPKWISLKGYWVIETNLKSSAVTILYFYNNDNHLMYKENLEGLKINLAKRRTKMRLKRMLEQKFALYEQTKK
jgi:hypothetical protein